MTPCINENNTELGKIVTFNDRNVGREHFGIFFSIVRN